MSFRTSSPLFPAAWTVFAPECERIDWPVVHDIARDRLDLNGFEGGEGLPPGPRCSALRVSRLTALMQSRISWHICGVNMLPSSGRLSVNQPIGPSSLYKMVSKLTADSPGRRVGR